MLGKLMKYEMSAMGRILLPLYGALLFMSLIMSIVVNVLDTLPIFVGIVVFLYIAAAMGAVVMTFILIVQRFYKNLLGNEGYLMFTLPVTTGRHIWNKGITAGIWMVAGVVAGGLSALIIVASTGQLVLSDPGIVFRAVWDEVGAMTLVYFLEVVLVVFLTAIVSVFRIYAAIAIGHLWGNHRILGAILAYLGIGIVESIIVNIFAWTESMTQFVNGIALWIEGINETGIVHLVLLGLSLILGIIACIYFLVVRYILHNKLNLE